MQPSLLSLAMRILRGPLALAAITTAVLAASGCGQRWQAATYPVHGKLEINGQVPSGAVVELHSQGSAPDQRNSRPWGIVDDSGGFKLTTYEANDGAPPGDYRLTIKWPPDASRPSLADRLNNAYSKPENSQWTVTVEERETDLGTIEVKGAKVLPAERAVARNAPPGPGMGSR